MLRSLCPLMYSNSSQKYSRQQTFFNDTLFKARQLAAIRSCFPMPSLISPFSFGHCPEQRFLTDQLGLWYQKGNSLVCLLVAYGCVLQFGCRLPRIRPSLRAMVQACWNEDTTTSGVLFSLGELVLVLGMTLSHWGLQLTGPKSLRSAAQGDTAAWRMYWDVLGCFGWNFAAQCNWELQAKSG